MTRHPARTLGRSLTAVLAAACLSSLAACASFTDVVGGEGASNAGGGQETTDPGGTSEINVLGTWTADETGTPELTFTEDGMVEGTDGCNGIATEYSVDGDTVTVEPFASTMMACEGVDPWLAGMATLTVADDAMTVLNSAGEEIGTLARQAGDAEAAPAEADEETDGAE